MLMSRYIDLATKEVNPLPAIRCYNLEVFVREMYPRFSYYCHRYRQVLPEYDRLRGVFTYCTDCRFWKSVPLDRWGVCPVPVASGLGSAVVSTPTVVP